MDNKNPIVSLRTALASVLDYAAFKYDEGSTRKVVSQARRVYRQTALPVAHQPPVGIFKYDKTNGSYVPVSEAEAKDKEGNLLPGYEYLFREASVTRH